MNYAETTAYPPAILGAIYEQQDLVEQAQIHGGHTGTLLMRVTDRAGNPKIVKTGTNPQAIAEVTDNIYGYESMRAQGAGPLLPPGMVNGTVEDTPYIIMPDLGASFANAAGSEPGTSYDTFFENTYQVCLATLEESPDEQRAGLQAFGEQVSRWYTELEASGLITPADLEKVGQINFSQLSSTRSSLMLMDFTPDNVFIKGKAMSFIDPWRQATYRGSLVPSLAQFWTLAAQVYKLPGTEKGDGAFKQHLLLVGEELGLTEEQIKGQAALGAALQFALSAYVRVNSDPGLSNYFADKSKEAIESLPGVKE